MGPLKRKGGPDGSSAAKSSIQNSELRPSKRSKSDEASNPTGESNAGAGAKDRSGRKGEKDGKGKESKTPSVSLLREEEPMFPRGGGSLLTPLEKKEIHAQAKLDVLFEHDTAGAQSTAASKTSKAKRRKSSHNADKSQDSRTTRDADAVKIESLTFQRLVKGTVVLGIVYAINPLDLVIALPGNLVGHVPITAISESLTSRLQEDVAEKEAGKERNGDTKGEDEDGDEDEDDHGSDVDLKSLFQIGQYVRAYVVSTMDESASAMPGRTKRHIELSLQPAHANSGLTEQGLVENCTVMASIASVEDHGFVMDLGLAASNVSGFLPTKQVDPAAPPEMLQPGTVFLCAVTGRKARGNVAQLSTLPERLASPKHWPSTATTIDTFQPGTVADVLISEVFHRGLVGKVMGHLDVTADRVHSGAGPEDVDLEDKYKVSSRVRARVICTFPAGDSPKLGVSVLPHVLALEPKMAAQDGKRLLPWEVLPSSSRVPKCKVKSVEASFGLYVDIGVDGVAGFVHISRVKDGKVEALFEDSGPHKIGTVHPGRVIGYNAFDGMFLISLEQTVLDQPYLRVEDVPVGDVVQGLVKELVIDERGVGGLVVSLAEGISGYVPQLHMADVHLQNPEKKFREGMKVKARVLSTNPERHQVRLTLKKTLVNSDCKLIKNFTDLEVNLASPGTIVKLFPTGALVEFYGAVRGFLPVSEMSEAYIKDPLEHFRLGQVCMCYVLNFDQHKRRLTVSCKDPAAFGMEKQLALKDLKVRDVVSAKVTQKTEHDIFVELLPSSLKAILSVSHLTDKSAKQTQSALRKIYVGQTLSDLVVLQKDDKRRSIILSHKPSLVTAAKEGKLLASYDDAVENQMVPGFIQNITGNAAFVEFADRVVAILPRSHIPPDQQQKDNFGFRKGQSVLVKIISVDKERRRVTVAIPSPADGKLAKTAETTDKAVGSLDASTTPADAFTIGQITSVRVSKVKSTQLNVRVGDNVPGRLDVSQIFDKWEDIPDPTNPLKHFHPRETIRARILGVHDARLHRFLPITSRSNYATLELSAKPSHLRQDTAPTPLSFADIQPGSTYLGFVNNVLRGNLWVSLSPSVRGRVSIMDVSDDLSELQDLDKSFPVGSAIRVRVLSVDAESQKLRLSARSQDPAKELDWDTIEEGLIVPAKVIKVDERQVVVRLSETLTGPVHLVDIADDYDEAITLEYSRHNIVRVAIVAMDKANKRMRLSLRPSRVMNSSLSVKDKEITQKTKLQVGDILRGFVKNVSDKGLFVSLGGDAVAMIQVKNLADGFLNQWKDGFKVDQVVKGRIISVAEGRIQMSLKHSVVEKDYAPLIHLEDIKEGQTITGRIQKVERYGAFIAVDGSERVSGLCHRSEMADKPVQDTGALYKVGDRVKALVLKVDLERRRMTLGLKPSYFDEDDDDDDDEMDVDGSDSDDDGNRDIEDMGEGDGNVVITGTGNAGGDDSSDEDEDDGSDVDMAEAPVSGPVGLDAGGFDWSGNAPDAGDGEGARSKKNGKVSATSKDKAVRKDHQHGGGPSVQEDRTAQLDAHGPQDAGDYNRLLLAQPDSSKLWIAYMAFQIQAGEGLEAARAVAERAVKTISMHEEQEKLQVWVAYMNLEHAFGTDESLEDIFKRACTYNDEETMHERLTTIYIQSGKNDKARALFENMIKKFGSRSGPDLWYNYAHFLHTTAGLADEARKLLPRVQKSLGPTSKTKETQVALVRRWAALEFRSPNGDRDQGRTLFENLLAAYPRMRDVWTQLLRLEMRGRADSKKGAGAAVATTAARGGGGGGEEKEIDDDPAVIRDLFERGAKAGGLNRRHGTQWFEWWAEWEGEHGDAKSKARVAARRREWERGLEARKSKAAGAEGAEGE